MAAALPAYAFYSLVRIMGAYVLSLIFAILYQDFRFALAPGDYSVCFQGEGSEDAPPTGFVDQCWDDVAFGDAPTLNPE